jgi:hypothetical protein
MGIYASVAGFYNWAEEYYVINIFSISISTANTTPA